MQGHEGDLQGHGEVIRAGPKRVIRTEPKGLSARGHREAIRAGPEGVVRAGSLGWPRGSGDSTPGVGVLQRPGAATVAPPGH